MKDKMKKIKEIIEKIQIPENIEVKLNELMEVKGPKGEVKKRIAARNVIVEIQGKEIIIKSKKVTKREGRLIHTLKAHVKNMLAGVVNPYVYKMQICSVHFPMTVTIEKSKNLLRIKNFIGEVKERTAHFIPGVDVSMDKDIITIESCDIEKAGQTAANIESATKIKGRDRRIFQDGIYIIHKAGEDI